MERPWDEKKLSVPLELSKELSTGAETQGQEEPRDVCSASEAWTWDSELFVELSQWC